MSQDIFDESNVPSSNWFKFEKVGSKVGGKVTDIFEKEGEGDYPDQKVFELEQEDGDTVFVGIAKTNKYIIPRTKKVRPGDMVGFEFKKEIPPKVKGHNPAKSIEVYVKYTEEGNAQRDGEELVS